MNNYIPPSVAYKQLKSAYDLNNSVYIYGATGYGKTKLVQEFLSDKEAIWLSSQDDIWNAEEIAERLDNLSEKIIVIDDIQFMDSDEKRRFISQYVRDNKAWVVIIGRIPSPQWMIPLIAEGLISVIAEKHFRLRADDIKELAFQSDVFLSEEDSAYLVEAAEGNAYAISATIQLYKYRPMALEDLRDNVYSMFVNHLEEEVIPEWDKSLQEFLMMVSVVDEFTLPMAVMITGDDQAALQIAKAEKFGNFIFLEDEVYRLRPQLIAALRNRALKVFGLNEYRRYMSNAAHYYEMQDDILNALELYEKCERKENIRSLLIRNGRRHPGSGHYYELRKYYLSLSDEEVENTPILMSALSLLYSILMNPEKSEFWYNKLLEYSKNDKSADKKEVVKLLLVLDMSLPHRGSKDILNVIKHAFSMMKSGKVNISDLSVTNNGPSAMNGGMDFCEWSKKDKLLAETIGKIIETVTGDMGKGLVHAGLCESIFEKGLNDAEAINYAMLINLDIESGGKFEIQFISVAIQARMAVITGNPDNALRIVESFANRISGYNNEALKRNLRAFKCRIDLVQGKIENAEEWLSLAPDTLLDFCILERYAYMTKALCYIQLGMNDEAVSILSKLRYYSEEYQRTYIHMETGLLLSLISRREGGEWKELFISTLFEIQEYQFVRIISEKSAGLLPLLKEVKNDFLSIKKADSKWFARVIKETEMLTKKYPNHLVSSSPQPSDFNELDIQILKLQAEGLSIKEIANSIFMSERTVKYHASENYRKLGVSGKVEAVQMAKNISLI